MHSSTTFSRSLIKSCTLRPINCVTWWSKRTKVVDPVSSITMTCNLNLSNNHPYQYTFLYNKNKNYIWIRFKYVGTALLQVVHLRQRRIPLSTVANEAHWVHDRKYHLTPVSISHIVASTEPWYTCKKFMAFCIKLLNINIDLNPKRYLKLSKSRQLPKLTQSYFWLSFS